MLYFIFTIGTSGRQISAFQNFGRKHQTDPLFIFMHIMGSLSDEVTSIIIVFLFCFCVITALLAISMFRPQFQRE